MAEDVNADELRAQIKYLTSLISQHKKTKSQPPRSRANALVIQNQSSQQRTVVAPGGRQVNSVNSCTKTTASIPGKYRASSGNAHSITKFTDNLNITHQTTSQNYESCPRQQAGTSSKYRYVRDPGKASHVKATQSLLKDTETTTHQAHSQKLGCPQSIQVVHRKPAGNQSVTESLRKSTSLKAKTNVGATQSSQELKRKVLPKSGGEVIGPASAKSVTADGKRSVIINKPNKYVVGPVSSRTVVPPSNSVPIVSVHRHDNVAGQAGQNASVTKLSSVRLSSSRVGAASEVAAKDAVLGKSNPDCSKASTKTEKQVGVTPKRTQIVTSSGVVRRKTAVVNTPVFAVTDTHKGAPPVASGSDVLKRAAVTAIRDKSEALGSAGGSGTVTIPVKKQPVMSPRISGQQDLSQTSSSGRTKAAKGTTHALYHQANMAKSQGKISNYVASPSHNTGNITSLSSIARTATSADPTKADNSIYGAKKRLTTADKTDMTVASKAGESLSSNNTSKRIIVKPSHEKINQARTVSAVGSSFTSGSPRKTSSSSVFKLTKYSSNPVQEANLTFSPHGSTKSASKYKWVAGQSPSKSSTDVTMTSVNMDKTAGGLEASVNMDKIAGLKAPQHSTVFMRAGHLAKREVFRDSIRGLRRSSTAPAALSLLIAQRKSPVTRPGQMETPMRQRTVKCSKYKLVKKPVHGSANKGTGHGPSSRYSLIRRSRSSSGSSVIKSPVLKAAVLKSLHHTAAVTVKLKSRYKLVKKALKVSQNKYHTTRINSSRSGATQYRNPGRGKRGRMHHTQIILSRKHGFIKPGRQQHTVYKASHSPHKVDNRFKPHRGNKDGTLDINRLLGRRVINISKNKYKFVKPKCATPLSHRARMRQTHHNSSPRKLTRTRRRSFKQTVFIRGVRYHSSKTSLNRADQRNTNRRIGSAQVKRGPTHSVTQMLASRAVQRSIRAAAVNKHKLSRVAKKNKPYCLFYNRFGKCNRGDQCPYTHDPDKVAVCTRFLRGTCHGNNCPFSHKVSPDKMPVCTYFLKGLCVRDDCPYLHVKVREDAEVCQDFLKGYCPKGTKCTKKHTLVCPEFARSGSCAKGKDCHMRHVQRKRRKRKSSSPGRSAESSLTKRRKESVDEEATVTKDAQNNQDVQHSDDLPDDRHLPMKDRVLPAFIALGDSDVIETPPQRTSREDTLDDTLHIHPRFILGS